MNPAPQFAVCRTQSRHAAKQLVVVVQADEFARMPSRVVAPLAPAEALPGIEHAHPRVAPLLLVQGRAYRLNPLDLATLGLHRLGEPVASFAQDAEARRRIQDALDAALRPF